MFLGELSGEALAFVVDEKVNIVLAEIADVFAWMLAQFGKAKCPKQFSKCSAEGPQNSVNSIPQIGGFIIGLRKLWLGTVPN